MGARARWGKKRLRAGLVSENTRRVILGAPNGHGEQFRELDGCVLHGGWCRVNVLAVKGKKLVVATSINRGTAK